MTTFHEIDEALRRLTREDWERVARSTVAEVRRELTEREPMPNEAEEYRFWLEGYLD